MTLRTIRYLNLKGEALDCTLHLELILEKSTDLSQNKVMNEALTLSTFHLCSHKHAIICPYLLLLV